MGILSKMGEPNRDVADCFITVQDAAKQAGVTEAAIRNAIYRGKLPTVRKYGRNLIPLEAFSTYRANARPGRPSKATDRAAAGRLKASG